MNADSSSESASRHEKPGKRIEIPLDHEFLPFERGKKIEIVLKVTDSLHIPIDIYHKRNKSQRYGAVTPIHPDNGYQIDRDDFNPEQRKTKAHRFKDVLENHVDMMQDSDIIWVMGTIYGKPVIATELGRQHLKYIQK